jgi:putative sterol carrier protein
MTDVPTTLRDMIYAMPKFANHDALKDVNKSVQFNFSGDEAGTYYLDVTNGEVTVHDGPAPAPDVTIEAPSEVWKAISTGDMNGAVAFMTGKFKAAGDITLLMAMQSWFNLPGNG